MNKLEEKLRALGKIPPKPAPETPIEETIVYNTIEITDSHPVLAPHINQQAGHRAPAKEADGFDLLLDKPLPAKLPIQDAQQLAINNAIHLCTELEVALLNKFPDMPKYLNATLSCLRESPELTHILTDEQIAPLYKTLIQRANFEVAITKSRAKGKKNSGLLDTGESMADLI